MFRSIACLLVALPCVLLAPSQSFPNMVQLNSMYDLYWEANSTYIMFEVDVQTNGMVGFGISETGLMFPGDVIMAWVSHGQAEFQDSYAGMHGPPTKDASQDWTLYSSSEHGPTTTLTFGRPLNTHDDQDLVIHPGKVHVIYSWTDVDPTGWDDLTYHGKINRGSMEVDLLGGQGPAVGK
ncbi:DBH-like monooxygenase protein [Mactra antiquata]